MELALKQGWTEISQEESGDIEGGCWPYLIVPIGTIMLWDLKNCYENGYNEVMLNAQ